MSEKPTQGEYGMLGLTPGQEHMRKFVKTSFGESVKSFFKKDNDESTTDESNPEQKKIEPEHKPAKESAPLEKAKEKSPESIEKKREQVKESVAESIAILKKFLQENQDSLDEATKQQLAWAIRAAESAKQASLDLDKDRYAVTVLDESGKPAVDKDGNVVQRMESMPVDGLIAGLELVAEKVASSKSERAITDRKLQQIEDIKDYLNAQVPLGFPGEESLEAFLEKTTPDIKSELVTMVEAWQKADQSESGMHHGQIDSATGKYNREFYVQQFLEAAKQLEQQYAAPVATSSKTDQGSKAKELADTLRANSKNYFDDHYGKPRGEGMTQAESEEQDHYTRREANLISKDAEYRSGLMAKYASEIKGFDQMSENEQNYQLAMLALRDRAVLDMPEKPKEAESPEKKLDKILLIDIDEIVKGMAARQAEQKLHEQFKDSGFLKRTWKSLSESGYRYKFYKEALKQIKENNDLMEAIRGRLAGQKGESIKPGLEDHFKLLDEIILSYEENLVNATETGEKVEQTSQTAELIAKMVSAHASGSVEEWAKLGEEYADPKLSDRQRVELYVKNVIVPSIPGAGKPGKDGEGTETMMFASNFWQIAEDFKSKSDAEKAKYLQEAGAELSPEDKERVEAALAEHMNGLRNLDIQLGTKERDLYNNKPQGILKFYEKAMDWSERSRFGGILVNPLTVGIGSAVATRGAMSAVRAAAVGGASIAGGVLIGGTLPVLLPILVGGAAGGLYRAFRANKDLKYDLAKERRNETLGGDRSELLKDELRYDQMGYNDAVSTLTKFSDRSPESLSPQEQQEVIKILAMREWEKQPDNKVDLFFADSDEAARTGSVIGLRNKLDINLRNWEGKFDKAVIDEAVKTLSTNIQEKDKAESTFRLKKSAYAGATAAAMGVGAGLVAQEAIYIAGRHLGLIDSGKGTAMEAIFDKVMDSKNHAYNWMFGRANNLVDAGDPGLYHGPDGKSFTEQQLTEMKASGNVIVKDLDGVYHDSSGNVISPEQAQAMAGRSTVVENLQREDWHGMGKNFHGKELQQWHVWDKGQDSVKIDVHNMMRSLEKNIVGNHTINWDKTTDPKLIELLGEMRQFKNGGALHEHIQVRIFPTQEMYNAGQGVNAGHIDANGGLELSEELRKTAFSADGKQLARAIEVGYTDQNGEYHVLNTAVGKGDMQVLEGATIVEQMKPADYDWFTALVPPKREIYGREGDKEEKPAEQKATEATAESEAVTKPSESLAKPESAPIPKPAEPLPNAVPELVIPEIEPAPYNAEAAERDKKRNLNSMYSFFSTEGAENMGDNLKVAFGSFEEEQARKIVERSQKVKLDFPVTSRMRDNSDYAKQVLDFILNMDQKAFDRMDEVLIVNPSKTKYQAKNGVVLLATETPKIWFGKVQGFKRISVKKGEAQTIKPINK